MKYRQKINQTLFFLCALAVAPSAMAASHYKDRFISQYDQNGDGMLSLEEFDSARRARFDNTDTDGNGVVSADEYAYEWEDRLDEMIEKERVGKMQAAREEFASLDGDDDGIVTAAEFNALGDQIFAGHDHNGDAQIDAADLELAAKLDAGGGKNSYAGGGSRSWIRMPSAQSAEGFFELFDVNADEVVSRDEFDAERRASYSLMDYDRDGGIDIDEYVADYEERLDRQIDRIRRGQVRQAYVRFGALDDDDNGEMTFAEYQKSGHRSFARFDTNEDEVVSMADPLPTRDRPNNAAADATREQRVSSTN